MELIRGSETLTAQVELEKQGKGDEVALLVDGWYVLTLKVDENGQVYGMRNHSAAHRFSPVAPHGGSNYMVIVDDRRN